MAQTLEHNSSIMNVIPVELPFFEEDMEIIQKLDDEPNDVGGLSAEQLKARFDRAGQQTKDYINGDLIPAVIAEGLTEQHRAAAEAERVTNEQERVSNEAVRVAAEQARGVWEPYDPSRAYIPGNKVSYQGSSYLNTKACRGVAPTDGGYWFLIAKMGVSILRTVLTAGDHTPGTTDTYTTYFSDGSTSTFTVYNGADGKGAGDMRSDVYDPTGKRKDIFAAIDALKPAVTTVSLPAASWGGDPAAQTVVVYGAKTDELAQVIEPIPSAASMSAYKDAGIMCACPENDRLVFTAEKAPAQTLTVHIVIRPL